MLRFIETLYWNLYEELKQLCDYNRHLIRYSAARRHSKIKLYEIITLLEQQEVFALLQKVAKSVRPATDSDYNGTYSEEVIAHFTVYVSLSLVFVNCSDASLILYDLRSQPKLVHLWE
jgi:hypothetical protein